MRYLAILSLVALLCSCNAKTKTDEQVKLTPIMEKALFDKQSRFYANFEQFPAERKLLPIGVFDSGTGGLTVLEVMLSLDKMDNITGELVSDGIPDFSGENFQFLIASAQDRRSD